MRARPRPTSSTAPSATPARRGAPPVSARRGDPVESAVAGVGVERRSRHPHRRRPERVDPRRSLRRAGGLCDEAYEAELAAAAESILDWPHRLRV